MKDYIAPELEKVEYMTEDVLSFSGNKGENQNTNLNNIFYFE